MIYYWSSYEKLFYDCPARSDLYAACSNIRHVCQIAIKIALELRDKFVLQQTDRQKDTWVDQLP